MILYHGTSDVHLEDIQEKGLQNPYLTNAFDLAEYYAECAVDDMGGSMVVITVEVDGKNLRYDGNAIDEPVRFGEYTRISQLEEIVQEMWNEQGKLHPEWLKNDCIIIPSDQYRLSLETVASCRHDGIVSPENIIEID